MTAEGVRKAVVKTGRPRGWNIVVAAQKSPPGLAILVHMPYEAAKAFADRANTPGRKRSAARAAIGAAVGNISGTKPRERKGLLQGNIPKVVIRRLKANADACGRDSASLLRDILHRWINPNTGKRRRRDSATSPGPCGPADYRTYAGCARQVHSDEKAKGALARFQVEVGAKVADRIVLLLKSAQVPQGEFLTALCLDACGELGHSGEATAPALA